MERPQVDIVNALLPQHLEACRSLFSEYGQSLDIDLCFQDFDAELATLPGAYAVEAGGALLLAYVDGQAAGCCGLRRLQDVDYAGAAEMKRLYVRKMFRGFGIGRALTEAILDAARLGDYHCVLLDTLSEMETARALYQELGFYEIAPYYHNPIAGAHYLKVDL